MELKLFELRDRSTFIPIFAFRCRPTPTEDYSPALQERYLLARAGFERNGLDDHVIIGCLECSETARSCTYDPFAWGVNPRTYHIAHGYIASHWEVLSSGDVVDVEYILMETHQPKLSERVTHPEG